MTLYEASRILNLIASLVLAYGSYRAHRWARKQTKLSDAVAAAAIREANTATNDVASSAAPGGGLLSTSTRVLLGPYFDKTAYFLFLVGFVASTIVAVVDLMLAFDVNS